MYAYEYMYNGVPIQGFIEAPNPTEAAQHLIFQGKHALIISAAPVFYELEEGETEELLLQVTQAMTEKFRFNPAIH